MALMQQIFRESFTEMKWKTMSDLKLFNMITCINSRLGTFLGLL